VVCAAGLGTGERRFGKNGFRRVREALVLIARFVLQVEPGVRLALTADACGHRR
jgi:hypothetical protein